jgi:hypothetical protein
MKAAGLAQRADTDEAREVNVLAGEPDAQASKPTRTKTQRPGDRRHRQRGDRQERGLVRVLQAAGFAASRIPLSGSADGKFSGDVTAPLLGRNLVIEVKSRRRFAQLYEWIDDTDVLVVQGDRQQPLVFLRLQFALEVAAAADRGKGGGNV